MALLHLVCTDERTQTFVSEYETKYGVTPNQFAADAYDGVYIVYEALKTAGCTADTRKS